MILWIKKTLLFIVENFLLAVLLMLMSTLLLIKTPYMNDWGRTVLFVFFASLIPLGYGFITKKLGRTPIMFCLGLVFDKKITNVGIARFILVGRFLFTITFFFLLARYVTFTMWGHWMAFWVLAVSIGAMYNLYFFWWVYKIAFYGENIFALSVGANVIQNRREKSK